MGLISILRELIQKQSGKRHRQHLSAGIPSALISEPKRRSGAAQIFQNRAEKVLDEADATHKHLPENVRHTSTGGLCNYTFLTVILAIRERRGKMQRVTLIIIIEYACIACS